MNREKYLTELAERLNSALFQHKMPRYRVTCGFPSRGALAKKNRTLGQCWFTDSSEDKTHELIVSMVIDDPMEVAGCLAHEMVHAVVGREAGHRKPFRDLALDIGLEGKMTATTEGEAFKQSVQPILDELGPYPHAKLDPETKKKQTTRLIKCECQTCGYNVRVTRKWIELGAPHCPNHGQMQVV